MTSKSHQHMTGRRLTTVDHEMLQFLVEGLANKEIATLTGKSIDTIKSRMVALYARLGVSTRAQAVAAAYGREEYVTATEDDNKQLRATIAGLRAKVSELAGKLLGAEELARQRLEQRETAERELADLKRLLTTTDLPAGWLDSTQGRL